MAEISPVSSMSLLFPGGTCDCANPVVPQLFAALAAEGAAGTTAANRLPISSISTALLQRQMPPALHRFRNDHAQRPRRCRVLPHDKRHSVLSDFRRTRCGERASSDEIARLLTDMAKVSYLADKGLSEILVRKNHPAAFSPYSRPA